MKHLPLYFTFMDKLLATRGQFQKGKLITILSAYVLTIVGPKDCEGLEPISTTLFSTIKDEYYQSLLC